MNMTEFYETLSRLRRMRKYKFVPYISSLGCIRLRAVNDTLCPLEAVNLVVNDVNTLFDIAGKQLGFSKRDAVRIMSAADSRHSSRVRNKLLRALNLTEAKLNVSYIAQVP